MFVEIKQRVDRVTQKRRAVLPYADALELCDERIVPEHEARDEAVVNEAFELVVRHNLEPACITTYQREPWIGGEYDPGLRVTIDSDLRYRVHDLWLDSKNPGSTCSRLSTRCWRSKPTTGCRTGSPISWGGTTSSSPA